MAETSQLEWVHPQAEQGIESHRFHREKLTKVRGHILGPSEIADTKIMSETAVAALNNYKESVSLDMPALAYDLLKDLGVTPVKGLPLRQNPEEYIRENSLFINGSGDESRIGISNPNSGRAITINEGWVFNDGAGYLDHGYKGVGQTKSISASFKGEAIEDSLGSGIFTTAEVARDLVGSKIAADNKVLSPKILPPIVLEELIINGEKVPSKSVLKENVPIILPRLWASDRRVNGLWIATSPFLTPSILNRVIEDPNIFSKVFEKQIERFLNQCKIVDIFNKKHGTTYFLGLSQLLEGKYNTQSYAEAFRAQTRGNIVRMLNANFIDDNYSSQNTAISGEVGDYDAIATFSQNKLYLYEDENMTVSKKVSDKARLLADLIVNTYTMQAYISAFGKIEFISISDFWNQIYNQLDSESWVKEFTFQKIEKVLGKTRLLSDFWNNSLLSLTKKVRQI